MESELICSTAYVELFLRRVNEPSLLAVFLRYIFTDSCDGKSIIDTLVSRVGLQSQVYNFRIQILISKNYLTMNVFQLCTVTLSLFEILVGLNCEDVMFWLIFRYLIPMNYMLPTQTALIRQPDVHGRGSEKMLSLVPICCIEASLTANNNSTVHEDSFHSNHRASSLISQSSGLNTSSMSTISSSSNPVRSDAVA